MKSQLIINEIELGQNGITAYKGKFVSKEKVADLDKLCYYQILIDLEIDLLGVKQ